MMDNDQNNCYCSYTVELWNIIFDVNLIGNRFFFFISELNVVKQQWYKSCQENKNNDLPKPQPSKMTKKEAEEKLKALLQQEKKLQDKLRKVNAASPEKPEKDW